MIAWIIVMIALTMSVIMVVTPLYFINNIVHKINDFCLVFSKLIVFNPNR